MRLYFSPGACSLSPRIVLHEAGLIAEFTRVDLTSKQIEGGGDYRDLNPKGYVPALQLDDGQVLTEGPAIVQYLADLVPGKHLAPMAGTIDRYRLMEWLNFISAELHKGFGQLFNSKAPAEWKSVVRGRLSAHLDFASRQLGNNSYAMGAGFTVVDAYLFAVLRWAPIVGVDLSIWPTLTTYVERVGSRPLVRQALMEEGLLKGE